MTIMSREGAKYWWGVDLPKHIAYLYKPIGHEKEWTEYTYKEIFAKKKAKQDYNIRCKREYNRKVPCYIYVFNCNSDFLFGGWYVMIITRKKEWYLNWRTQWKYEKILPKIKQKLNFGMLFPDFDDMWYREFCKKNPIKPKGIAYPRGAYFTHCTVDNYNNLIDIDI